MKHFGLVLVLLVAASGSAQKLMNWGSTGNDLIALCKDGDDDASSSLPKLLHAANCEGFIYGVVESHPNLCVPDGVTERQMEKMIYAYTDKNPAFLHYPAAVIVYSAMEDGFGTNEKRKCP